MSPLIPLPVVSTELQMLRVSEQARLRLRKNSGGRPLTGIAF